MKIAIFVHEDYAFTFDLMHALIPKLLQKHEVSAIFCFPDRLTKYTGIMIYQKYLERFGISVFAQLLFMNVIKKLKIIYDYVFHRQQYYSFNSMCSYYGIKKINYHNPNDEAVAGWIRDNKIDIILIFIGHILKSNIIQAPRMCILNKHAALLPLNKGVFPVFWALANNEPVGVTIHKVNENIDGGEIILQKIYEKRNDWSVYDYYRLIFSDTPELILESFELLGSNSNRKIGNNLQSSYHGLPIRKEYLCFRKQGLKFV